MKIPLFAIAHARSGDKGDVLNIGVIARRPEHYSVLLREVTVERVRAHFGELVKGSIERYELPNLEALNFVIHTFRMPATDIIPGWQEREQIIGRLATFDDRIYLRRVVRPVLQGLDISVEELRKARRRLNAQGTVPISASAPVS